MPWFKGNLHTHTNNSDGDSSPETVVDWYSNNKYDFLVLSDHNHLTILDSNQTKLLLIPGEEITLNLPYTIHINAIGIKKVIEPTLRSTKVKTLQANIDNIINSGGLAEINHPNFRWALNEKDLVQVRGAHFIEVFNGNYNTHNYGGGGKKSVEEMWDEMLSKKIKIWGVAVDDSHHFKEEFAPHRHNPGRGWVEVFAKNLSEKNILDSMRNGNFYFSNGVKFKNIKFNKEKIELSIAGDYFNKGLSNSLLTDSKYTTQLISNEGEIIEEINGKSVKFNLVNENNEYTYYRTKTISSTGSIGWTQPIFIN
ncbi:MAG: CehA/McbA family metallohydrolase [Chloroflexota bacterium]|nr:CehA/McbA family metallohydrolase [Chloroflexota bacterium]